MAFPNKGWTSRRPTIIKRLCRVTSSQLRMIFQNTSSIMSVQVPRFCFGLITGFMTGCWLPNSLSYLGVPRMLKPMLNATWTRWVARFYGGPFRRNLLDWEEDELFCPLDLLIDKVKLLIATWVSSSP